MTYYGEVTAVCRHCNETLRRDTVRADDRAHVLKWISELREQFRNEFPKAQIDSHFESSE